MLPKLIQQGIGNPNGSWSGIDIKFVVRNLPKKKTPDLEDRPSGKSHQTLKEENSLSMDCAKKTEETALSNSLEGQCDWYKIRKRYFKKWQATIPHEHRCKN